MDRLDDGGLRKVEASRVDPEVYIRRELFEQAAKLAPHVGPTPVEMLFMDLPLLTGNEDPQALYIAASARPWPGSVTLYSSTTDSDYALTALVNRPSVIGQLQTPLLRGPTGIWDRQQGVQVKLLAGSLSSAEQMAVFSGANTLAIGDGTSDLWEIVQFAQAAPVGVRRYEISQLLRGQAGTSKMIQDAWPKGSFVVVMNGSPQQISMPTAALGLERHYRYGPAKQAMSAPSFKYVKHQFDGNGNRPYPVVHLRQSVHGGDHAFKWIRATRMGGDPWGKIEVPLAESSERYLVTIRQNGTVVRQQSVTQPNWTYSGSAQQSDVGAQGYQIAVSQVSDLYGAGPETTLTIDGGG